MEKKLVLQNKIEELAKLPPFVEELGEELGLPKELMFDFNLVLEEAVSNIIFYAYSDDVHESFTLTAKVKENQLFFVLVDSGKEFNPTLVPDADITLSADERPIGGLGIFLIRQMMSSVEYQRVDGKNMLIMGKRLD